MGARHPVANVRPIGPAQYRPDSIDTLSPAALPDRQQEQAHDAGSIDGDRSVSVFV
jgi:hypothetical protein